MSNVIRSVRSHLANNQISLLSYSKKILTSNRYSIRIYYYLKSFHSTTKQQHQQQQDLIRRYYSTRSYTMEKFNGFPPLVAFVLGGPGSGKGTQCKSICEDFGFAHLSAGDLLRAERNSPGSVYGDMIEKYIQEGRIVPVELTCSLLEKAMIAHCKKLLELSKQNNQTNQLTSSTNGISSPFLSQAGDEQEELRGKFLIDGFPRNEDNLQGWTKVLSDKVEIKFVLFLDCPHDICVQRCLNRGQLGSNRSDDNEASLRKRLVTFTQDTMPIIEHYEKLNLLKTIDASKPLDEVYSEVKKLFTM